ncbi:MAG: ParB N-terminal domain-containing protein [Chloroflexota bacterium]
MADQSSKKKVVRRSSKKKTAARDHALFGQIGSFGTASEPETLSINQLIPDPDQPRVLLSPSHHQALHSGKLSPQELLRLWQEEARRDFGDDEANWPTELATIGELAVSIETHGLINAITARKVPAGLNVPDGVQYLITTGERRFWAHVWLGKSEIPARIESGERIRGAQLVENLHRDDLSAFEKAMGLELYRQELTEIDPNDKEAKWSDVERSLPIKKRHRIRFTNVLQLSGEALTLLQTHRFAEYAIRPIVEKLRADPALQIDALNHLIQIQNGADVAPLKTYIDQLLVSREAVERPSRPVSTRKSNTGMTLRRWEKSVRSTINFLDEPLPLDELDQKTQNEMRSDLMVLRERIEETLRELNE